MDHVLYFLAGGTRASARAVEDAIEAVSKRISPLRAKQVRVAVETSSARTLAKLRSGMVDALFVDAREELGSTEDSAALALLRALFDEHEVANVIGRERVSLACASDERGAALAFEAGRLHLAGVVSGDGQPAWEAIWERIVSTVARGKGGKIAICLAGGGTEGLLYEIAVLRALDRFFGDYDVTRADILCGISAGAILGGLLANGLSPDCLAEGLMTGNDRVTPIRRSDLFDPNLGELAQRAARLSWDVLRGRRSPLSAMFRLPPAGVFAGKRLARWLKGQFERPGMIDDFDALPRKLFIGATDQDTSEHVVFGSRTAPRVPIHTAIRASTALAPFYAPEKIDGRYYVDGGFTRTTNMRVAVQEGATLVILVDPLVPISSAQPGHVAERGAIYGAMQGLKSLINGRFDKAVPTLRAMYPHVAFHLFQPGEDACRVMAGSPMKYFYRREVQEIAYRETVRSIRTTRFGVLERDFARHGVTFRDPDGAPSRNHDQEDVRVVA
jgi:NTE family protein